MSISMPSDLRRIRYLFGRLLWAKQLLYIGHIELRSHSGHGRSRYGMWPLYKRSTICQLPAKRTFMSLQIPCTYLLHVLHAPT